MKYYALVAAAALLMGCPERDVNKPVDMQEYYQKEKDRKQLDKLQNELRQDEIRRKGYSNIERKP
jgi:hypothetical protein